MRKSEIQVKNKPFTMKQEIFINEYVRTGDKALATKASGYCDSTTTNLLRRADIMNEIQVRTEKAREDGIATGTDAMLFLTQVMNGEIKDQFGLDAQLRDRIDACKEILKRTIDIEIKAQERKEQSNNNEFHLSIDWSRPQSDDLNEIEIPNEVIEENEQE